MGKNSYYNSLDFRKSNKEASLKRIEEFRLKKRLIMEFIERNKIIKENTRTVLIEKYIN